MATAPSFWAAGGNKIKTAHSPNPKIAEAPPKSKPVSQQKKGLVLRGMPNGHTTNGALNGSSSKSPTTNNVMKVNWAEEDDDEDFIKEFMSQDPKIAILETTVALKEERVKELDAVVITKTLRIAELEGAVQDKDHHIGDLEAELQEKDNKLDQLKKENSDQFLHQQELLREADEKDGLVEKLKAELEEKVVIIRDLEQESASRVPVPTSDTGLTTEGEFRKGVSEKTKADVSAIVTNTETDAEKATAESSEVESFEMVDVPTTEMVKEEKTETATAEESKETAPAKKPHNPSFAETDFPTFVTRDTLKVVPPAPKPKTLTFTIDMSKYGKKSTALSPTTKTVPTWSPMAKKNGHTTPWGQSSRQARDKTGAMPEFNYSVDIRHMPHGKRIVFGNGPEVIVKLGDVKLASVSKYVLMQCSFKALEYFTKDPEATSWVLPTGSMDADAATAHLKWMDEMTYQSRVYSLKLQIEAVYDKRNLQICRAARVLGLNNMYVAQFTKQFCDRIRAQDVSHEFIDLVCQLAYPDNDPVFDCLANNLVNQKKAGNAQGAAALEQLVAKYALLKEKVEKIEKRMMGRPCKTWKSPEGSVRGGSNDRSGGKGLKGGNVGQPLPSVVQPAPGNKLVAPAAGEALFTTLH